MRIAAKSLFIGHSLPDQRLGFQRIHGRKPVYTSSPFAKAEHNAASLIARRTCFRAQDAGAHVAASWTPLRRYFTTGERADDAASGRLERTGRAGSLLSWRVLQRKCQPALLVICDLGRGDRRRKILTLGASRIGPVGQVCRKLPSGTCRGLDHF